ncbi:UNKNOWN [Stylonychia lemnae]|uniref:Uncharacterized protein n=1 Tax=Stylonychia lemnae TaxID=5949 RepID=A0A078A3C1_STYLE|nr:UNKNOWN [Stylonychia lemnae]|eukprot:CDW75259.1 UNKNOWN [Stylonychia lemnae]
MNQTSQAVSDQSRRLKELKQELNQIKSGSTLNRTTIRQNNMDDSQNKTMLMDQSNLKINQTQLNQTSMMPPKGSSKLKKRSNSRESRRSTANQKPIIEYNSSSSDDEDNQSKKLRNIDPSDQKAQLCHNILDIFTKASNIQEQKEQLDQPKSRSVKMANQIKIDKIREIVTVFEKDLGNLELQTKKELDKMDRDEDTGKRRKETAQKMINDLEKRLFESERERVLLRREKDDLNKDIKEINSMTERNTVNMEMLNMIKENQKRLEETNKRMQEAIVRQEKEFRDKEDAWSTEFRIVQEKFQVRAKQNHQQQ